MTINPSVEVSFDSSISSTVMKIDGDFSEIFVFGVPGLAEKWVGRP